MKAFLVTLGVLALALEGCVIAPATNHKDVPLEGSELGLATQAAPVALNAWWTSYGDPQLDRLMTQALANSPTLAEALARVRVAQERDLVARSRLLPTIDFNASDLNSELTLAKLKTINEVILPADTMGVIDRAAYIQWGMRAVDPNLAQDVLVSQQQAANQEITDEQSQFAKLFSGTEPDMQQGGQNFALRLQTLQGIIQRNPNVQKRYAVDQIFKAMVDARMKHFNFQLQQQPH